MHRDGRPVALLASLAAALFLFFLVSLLLLAQVSSAGGFFDGGYTGSTVNKNEWDVECGTGLCSRNDPLCCGFNGEEYCIPGGQKCCAGIQPGPTNIASCGIDQDCCQAGSDKNYAIECCNRTQSCLSGMCVDDPCSNTTNQEYCLASPQCQWCCAENRCMLKGVEGQFDQPRCGSFQVIDSDVYTYYTNPESGKTFPRFNDLPPYRTGPGEPQCNKCNLQKSCGDCIRAGNYSASSNDGGYTRGGCAWCAQTQSCWPADVIQDSGFCQNRQYAGTPQQCEEVGPTGRGLHIQVSGDNDFGPIILGTFCFTILAIFFLACFRYIMFRRRLREWQMMMDPSLDIASSKGPKRPIVKKYGFKPEMKKTKDDKEDKNEEGENKNKEEKEEEDVEPKASCPSEVEVVSEGIIKCMACGKPIKLPVPRTEAPPCPPPATEEEQQEEDDKDQDEKSDVSEDGDDENQEERALLRGEKKKKKAALKEKSKGESMVGLADVNKVDADELLGGGKANQEQSNDEERPPPAGPSSNQEDPSRDEGPQEMLIALPCYHHLCVACGRAAVADQELRKKEKLDEISQKRKELEEVENKKNSKKSSSKKSAAAKTDTPSSSTGEDSSPPTISTGTTINSQDSPAARSNPPPSPHVASPTESEPAASSLSEAATRVMIQQQRKKVREEKKKEEDALTAAILDGVPLYCPRCGNTVECCIVLSKIIQN